MKFIHVFVPLTAFALSPFIMMLMYAVHHQDYLYGITTVVILGLGVGVIHTVIINIMRSLEKLETLNEPIGKDKISKK